MNRAIEFRAWVIKEQIYIPWEGMYGLEIESDGRPSVHVAIADQCYAMADEIVLEQFSGELDKKLTKIFEGDVVKVPAGYGGDHYYRECYGVIKYEGHSFYVETKNLSDYSWSELEAVGNIHQVSQLLLE